MGPSPRPPPFSNLNLAIYISSPDIQDAQLDIPNQKSPGSYYLNCFSSIHDYAVKSWDLDYSNRVGWEFEDLERTGLLITFSSFAPR